MKQLIQLFAWLVLFITQSERLKAQDTSLLKPIDTTKIEILHIDQLAGEQTIGINVLKMLGNVQMRQRDAYFWCDTGYLYGQNQLQAAGNVQLTQNDSVQVFSDSLFYEGIGRIATLKKNVVLKDTTASVFTDLLIYNLNTKIATYPNGVLIVSDTTQLLANQGYYNTQTHEAFFKDSVRVTNPSFKLKTDSLWFNTKTEVVTFLGKTLLYDKEKSLYAEQGYYDAKNQYAVFTKNASYTNNTGNKTEKATGDSIIYDGKKKQYYLLGNAQFTDKEKSVQADSIYFDELTEQYYFKGNPVFKSLDSTKTQTIKAGDSFYDKVSGSMIFRKGVVLTDKEKKLVADSLNYNESKKEGTAVGNVQLTDTINKSNLNAQYIYYNDSTGRMLAHTEPLFSTVLDKDTLWLAADTLLMLSPTLPDSTVAQTDSLNSQTDSLNAKPVAPKQRDLRAYHNVVIYKSNLQALCDSLVFTNADSSFVLYDKPILWADTVQFTADTIGFKMEKSQLRNIQLRKNSLIVQEKDKQFYNQIKADYIDARLDSNKLQSADARKDSEVIYYLQTEKQAYAGVNRVLSTDLKISFDKGQIDKIRFFEKPAALMIPMAQVVPEQLRLKNFQFFEKKRPKKFADIKTCRIFAISKEQTK